MQEEIGIDLDLFGLEGKEEQLILPGEKADNEEDKLDFKEITESNVDYAISGEVVRSTLTTKNSGLMAPYYMLDLSHVESLTNALFTAIKTFLKANGDTYFYIKTKDKILSKGKVEREQDHMILKSVLDSLLGDECRLYMNLGKKLEEVNTRDVRSVRLKL